MIFKKVFLSLLLALTLTGCAAHQVQTVNSEMTDQTGLSFLKDGETTKAEVSSRLGAQRAQFEGGRIVAYRLDKKYRVISPIHPGYGRKLWDWKTGNYSLVLVFDAAGILQRHSLVRIK